MGRNGIRSALKSDSNVSKTAYEVLCSCVDRLSRTGWLDLHRGNYMMRDNGNIVINDPFAE